jgi:dTDP-4-amino-4,6-dideoxygalactose transaminase
MRKASLDDLAVFGGRPAFEEPLHVGRPNLGDRARFFERINDIFDRRWLSNHGRYVEELERRIEELLEVRHCIATCNGTLALEIAIRAAGLEGEVIVPSFTFVATPHALRWQGVTPVFCDVLPERHTLDPAQVEILITPRTTGVIGVHLWGLPCEIDELTEIARRNDLTLLFDAAHAFLSTHRGRFVGNFGAAEILSFHATKFFNTFEGGAVVTNDEELARRARAMRDFGYVAGDTVEFVGTNGKMSEAAAAMGLTGLESVEEFVSANARNHARYTERLADLPGLALLPYDADERSSRQYVVIELGATTFGLSRDRLLLVLHAENVLARRYFFPPCHRMEPYRSLPGATDLLLPQTERLAASIATLPTGTALSADDVDDVCALIAFAHEKAMEIDARLDARQPPH